MSFKIIIFLNYLIQILLHQSCNNLLKTNKCFSNYCNLNPNNSKGCLINNILIIENTNGDIYLNHDLEYNGMIFGTTLSNNEDRIFYGFYYSDDIIYYSDNPDLPLKFNIDRTERKEIKNSEMVFFQITYDYILLFGSDNSIIEIYNINLESYRSFIEPTSFLSEDIIIKGNPTLLKFIDKNFYFTSITSTEEKSGYYNISFYEYNFNEIRYNISLSQIKKNHFEKEIKGEYISCDLDNENSILISCFYLTNDNNYTIILIKNDIDEFIWKNNIVVEQKEDINFEKPFFMKVVLFSLDFCIYAYYSGDFNDIPTFLIKTISQTDYSINDKFDDFPVVYLYDYKFNNEKIYNDLVTNEIDEFYFISTDKDIENIIISNVKFYLSNDNKEQLLIRYYTIPLKLNYNMKILNGLKTIYFNVNNIDYIPFLTLGFDFCFNEKCDNLNNAGLIILSFPNVITNDTLDFIEYAFNNNINYVIMNFTEIFGIQNNIFGYSIDRFFFFF